MPMWITTVYLYFSLTGKLRWDDIHLITPHTPKYHYTSIHHVDFINSFFISKGTSKCSCSLCVCVCVYILPLWRFLPTARCLRHVWEVRINDLVLWIFLWAFLPSPFISISESIIFHLQRRNFSQPKNWRENDMI